METISISTNFLGRTHRETISTRNNIAIFNHLSLNALNCFIIATKTYICLYVAVLWSDRKSSQMCLWNKYRYLLLELVPMFTTRLYAPVNTFSWVKPVCSNEDEVSYSRKQHSAPGEIPTCYQVSYSIN